MKKFLKLLVIFFSLFLFVGCLVSCGKETPTQPTDGVIETPTVEVDQKEVIYNLAVSSGYTGTYEEWLKSIQGDEIELSVKDNYIVWKYKSELTWRNLISLAELLGETGNGISSITLTKTEGLIDTYTITYTNGTTTTFTVTNGKDGVNGEQGIQGIQGVPGKDGHTPVITIEGGYWYIDGVNTNILAEGIQGETGNGISSITLTKTEGLIDTYTITFTNGSTTTFTVTNGKDGVNGKTPEFRVFNGYLQWKYTTDSNWISLYEISTDEAVEPETKQTITVTFVTEWEITNDGVIMPITKFEREIPVGAITRPTDIIDEDKFCESWMYYDIYEDEYLEWKFEYYYASNDITLYGEVYDKVTVTLLDEDGNVYKEIEGSEKGIKLNDYKPKNETFFFKSWVDENGVEYNNIYYGKKDITLSPSIVKSYKVTYLDENGFTYITEILDPDYLYVSYYSYTPKSDLYFIGWSLDGETPFSANTLVTEDIVLKPLLSATRKVINLVYSGTMSDEEFNMELIEDFKVAMANEGDPNIYNITYVGHSPQTVDSKVVDWSATDAPDVYEFASDRLSYLYAKGALSELTGIYDIFIDKELNNVAKQFATFNDAYYAYPYTYDNTYYLQYDKSKITDEQAKDMIKLMDAANTKGLKVGYNVGEGFYGAGAMFTFGADYSYGYNLSDITATFNTEAGLKAAKAILSIVKHPAWVDTSSVPGATDNVCAVIGGTWDIAGYKALWGDNYGCAVMPTVTVDGDTKHLGAFSDGKLLGVNPQRAQGNADQLEAAHKLAKFLAGKECQLKRFENAEIAPCHIEASQDPQVQSSPNAKVLSEQGSFAHAITSVPDGLWNAPGVMITAMKDDECTLENLQDYIDTFNNTVIGSSSHYCESCVDSWELKPGETCIYQGVCTLCEKNITKCQHSNSIYCSSCGYNNLYISGYITEWQFLPEYKFTPSENSLTIILKLSQSDSFIIATPDWDYCYSTIKNTDSYLEVDEFGYNLTCNVTGDYQINIYGIDTGNFQLEWIYLS